MKVSNEIYKGIVTMKDAVAEGQFDDLIYERQCTFVEALSNWLYARNLKTFDVTVALTVLTCGDFVLHFGAVDRFDLPTTELCCNSYKEVKKEYYKGFTTLIVHNSSYEGEQYGRYHMLKVYKNGRVSELKLGKWVSEDHITAGISECKKKKNKSYLHRNPRLNLMH